MGFGEAIGACFQKYVTFSGRARRPEYWYFYLFLIVVSIVAGLVDGMIFGFDPETSISPISTVFSLATLLPILAVSWRRLHDIGKPGYYNFIVLVAMIPAGVLFYAGLQIAPDFSIALFVIAGLIILAAVIIQLVWLVSPTQKGANQYGPEPGAEVQVEGVFE